jgi:propanol-preferring alcohol dehydrogenase
MKAVQLVRPNELALSELPVPEPHAHEVLLEVMAAGICHTDITIRRDTLGLFAPGLVLGHEIAGRVSRVGDGVTEWKAGDFAIVYPCWSCGVCRECVAGRQNACRNTGNRLVPPPTPGVTVSGGMAEYVVVPISALVRAEGIDPAIAAVLPDAALVPYHAIRALESHLSPGAVVVIIGLGGLGHLAVQMMRALTATRVIALDINEQALNAIRDSVDLAINSGKEEAAERILEFTGGEGVDVVIDFVGNDATLKLAGAVVARSGALWIPGLGGGVLRFETAITSMTLPWGASLTKPYSGTYNDLVEIVALAREDRIHPTIQRYPFSEALKALDDLEAGKIHGRAVLIM